MSENDRSTDQGSAGDRRRADGLREQVDALKAGNLAETLKRIDDRLSEALGAGLKQTRSSVS